LPQEQTGSQMTWVGIDFGSQLAGTTVISYLKDQQICFRQSTKGRSADVFVSEMLNEILPSHVFIDAPLSLPGAYFGQHDDFMYRACDREVGAMSPMFLGGLTARAIRLKHEFSHLNFHEAYPSALTDTLKGLKKAYRKKNLQLLQEFETALAKELPFGLCNPLKNWHMADAVLCWLVGYRYSRAQCLTYGSHEEGLIYV
jgi:predicted nuclease with RNAse H fold